ncbi:uncharacterized protein G6M90_00g043370 [Metarhizium brunneum]|uniref:Uncharacterized protein n=1 Tax=Metarhizium brunneum TaxID=500148 RepID=A0A7D5Z215_9HYPO|nr:hypothetical protein G6M90_00g043370 [Metarhizium brunneum]
MPVNKTAMLEALHSALRNSNFHKRCFPDSDPTSQRQYVNWIENNTAHPTAPIAGWARWLRRLAPAPAPAPGAKPTAFTETMFPAAGDAKPAFLSMLIVSEVSEKRGADKELSRWGVDKADREG